jgi:glycerol-3-phosphate dehydrogenase
MKRQVQALSEKTFDLLIVGAGIYGAAAAWDAASRGLSVALIDKGDFGGGTSSNSLKIIHGGLRYLQSLDIMRMRESIRERRILMTIAPHLVHPLCCVMPTYGFLMKGKPVMRIGLLMNDLISFDRNRLDDPQKRIPAGKVISKEICMGLIPGLDDRKVTGGAFWTDGQVASTERLLLDYILSADKAGAVCANYVEATGFVKDARSVRGVEARDQLTGGTFEIRSKTVLNAAGGWVDKLLGRGLSKQNRVRLSTAMNLIIRRDILPQCAAGLIGRTKFRREDGSVYRGKRVLFITPWRRVTLAGTVHKPYTGDPDDMTVTETEIQAFLEEFNGAYPGTVIRREDVSFFHKGFLPMDGVNAKTGEVRLTKHYRLHDHEKEDGVSGLWTVVGVKYTTARDVAKKAVDAVCSKSKIKTGKSVSHKTPLTGGGIERFETFLSEALSQNVTGLTGSAIRHLVYQYGSEYGRILEYAEMHPIWKKTVPGSKDNEGHAVIAAEIIHAVREEAAVKLTDAVLRRTDLGAAGNPGEACLKTCAALMAKELGWDEKREKSELTETRAVFQPKGA